jgi:hypothetical protein
MAPKIPGDRLVLGLISVVRTLIVELSEKGLAFVNFRRRTRQNGAIAWRAAFPSIGIKE